MNDTRPTSARLDEVLASLPPDAIVAHREAQRLVVTPGGIFVLDARPGDTDTNAQRAAVAAQRTRELLAEHLSWVPFVDWFVISIAEQLGPEEHDTLPLDLVAATVLEGHAVGEEVAGEIRTLLGEGSLRPDWHDGLPVAIG